MKKIMLFLALGCTAPAIAQQVHPSHKVPIDKGLSAEWKDKLWSNERKVYIGEELKTIGMPCGGIAAGQLYVRGDGTLANWWIANNAYNTGYGVNELLNFATPQGPWKVCYQPFEPLSYIDQGFAVTLKQGKKTVTRQLSRKDFDDIGFVGEYPVAKISYASKSAPLPLQIEATVFSPFIPLNARESATPGTILRYTIKNTSAAKVSVVLTGWLQNMVCLDLKENAQNAASRNRVVRNSGQTSVTMDLVETSPTETIPRRKVVFQNFESGTYGEWKTEGKAFGKNPVSSSVAEADNVLGHGGSYLVNSKLTSLGDTATGKLISPEFTIKEDYINFTVAGGSYNDRTCMHLVVDGKIVKTITGDNTDELKPASWNVKDWKGKKAHLEVIDNEPGDWGHISLDDFVFSNLPADEKFFPAGHPYFGNVSLTVLDEKGRATSDYNPAIPSFTTTVAQKPLGEPLTGAVGTSLELAPGQTKEVTFLLTWYFPNRPLRYGEGGNWNKPIPTSGPAIGNMYANWFDHSLDVADWLTNNRERLTKQTFDFHNAYYNSTTLPYWLVQRIMMPVSTLATETCQWWANDKFWAWEGVGSCVGTCTHVWNYEHALSRLFPELERNIREKTDLSTSFQEDGGIQARNGWGGILIDGHAGAILKSYREHLSSKDNLFLSRNWGRIKKATEFIIKEDGDEDGIIEKEQANTYDIAFYGANTYVGGLYLAALRAAEEMALLMRDNAFAERCHTIFVKGKTNSVNKLWNGEYFVQDVDLKKHGKFQYADGCLSDQLFGQTWAHLSNLGYIYPEDKVKTALNSVWKYNWAPDVAVQNSVHKPERTYADAGEAGLLIATWPKSQHMGEDGVRYRDEVWTGIEYQVATNMIYEGMIEEGLSLVKAVHDRYDGVKHNPWNEIECGDHYARALASWGVLLALQDMQYDGPNGSLSFAPKIGKENFRSFFTAAEGWGTLQQQITPTQQSATVMLDYGKVKVRSLGVEVPKAVTKVVLLMGGKEIPVTMKQTKNHLQLNFEEITLRKGEAIRLLASF
jgi:non-lysosomal glucosylceramidase